MKKEITKVSIDSYDVDDTYTVWFKRGNKRGYHSYKIAKNNRWIWKLQRYLEFHQWEITSNFWVYPSITYTK